MIAKATPTFVTVSDSSETLSTLSDVRYLPEIKMAATTFGFDGRHRDFQESADIGQCRQTRIRVWHVGQKYMGVEVGMAAQSLTVEKLFPLPV